MRFEQAPVILPTRGPAMNRKPSVDLCTFYLRDISYRPSPLESGRLHGYA